MIKKLFLSSTLSILFVLVFSSAAFTQFKQRVHFAKGSSSATVKGIVRGYGYTNYIIGARSGQEISVNLSAANTFAVFTVFLPNGDNLEGATEQNEFSGELPESGDYVVRVYMMRSEARRKNSNAAYALKISIH
ncbi:MAG: hypothetical protein M3033_02845 [Acidobacteriota bacterium]|nr:hypothetical protein [Acidobacteriota bacterium]